MFKSTKFSLFALLAVSIFSLSIFAQDTNTNNDDADVDDGIEEIITTGSRIARNPLELAQPIEIISGEEYELRAYTNAADALTDIPGLGAVNSLSGDQSSLGAGQQVAANFGLGSSRTVTLVNGRRFVGSQSPVGGAGSGLAVDLNNIPSALIDRVEILPVGGAAIYGADAIAGVINFILKDDYEGAELTYNTFDYAGMDTDTSFNFTIGGNFADGRGNIVINAQVEDRGQVFYDQANQRIAQCEDGFFFENPNDPGQDIFGQKGTLYDASLSAAYDLGYADAQGRRTFGDNGGHICSTLISNPSEGVVTQLGFNELGGDFGQSYGAMRDDLFYNFNAPGNMAVMDPGVPFGEYYYTIGGSQYNIQDNRILRAGFERKNVGIFIKYDIADDHKMYLDIYNNRFFAEDDGSSSSAHYSDYYFGAVDTDNCNAGGTCYTPSNSINMRYNDPYLTAGTRAILDAQGFGPGDTLYVNKLWNELSPGLRGDGFENESSTQFYNLGFEGIFDLLDTEMTYDIGSSWGETRIISKEPIQIAARWAAALDYGINPATGEIDCKFNYVDDYQLAFTGLDAENDYYSDAIQGGGVSLGAPGDCAPYNPFGFNNPDNAAAKDYFSSYDNEGAKINQSSFYWNLAGTLPVFELPYGPIGFALGYDKRSEKANFDASQMAFYSVAVRGSQTRGSGGAFDIESQYFEISIPVLSDMPFVEDLRIDYGYRELENSNSLRTNKYDVDSLSVFWKINDDFAVRYSDQTTTKSPNIISLYSPQNPSFQQADDPCDSRYVDDGDFPANRAANCAAEGIDTSSFESFVAGGSIQGTSGGNPNLLDENGETTSFGIVFTPSYDFLEPYGDFTFTADYIEILLTDYVTTFSLEDFMVACYEGSSFPNNFCNNFQRNDQNQVLDFQVGAGNSGVIDFATYIYRMSWSQDFATLVMQPEGTLGDVDVRWRAYQQDKRFVADSGDPDDLIDKTGYASDPEWSWDMTVGWSYKNWYAYYQADFVDGGYINKIQTDVRADRYIGKNGQPITEYDSYWFDTIGLVYRPNDNMSFSVRVENPLDHDGSESRYQTERQISLIGRTITTQFKLKF
jgi:hypothetical protein